MFFDVLLHLGTLASIFIVYWQDLKEMFYEVISFANLGPLAGQPRERYPQARTFIMIVMATLPLFLILPINDMIETLYYNNVFIGVAIILTGCMLYVSDRMKPGKKTERSMTILDAVIIGLCQCVATIPGLSRSSQELFKMIPYVVTIVVLIVMSTRNKRENQPPAHLGLPYFREER